ncbi:anthranilate synthase component I family protein [Desulfurispirillum indicum]|uniref:Anthranilate synthase component 1 n=1 Tax=Desulfurispirillum indicum (strain ATCC BAA-1389 / DSM 22839 / S5) TaxID=653733 RepID=E6W0G1_DESIS|nr:anthranilate synthase component I family protein [Desulfurispirillum indicum]ADU66379.1 Anthranilate synthase [Desulfurispirillum indicum S5]UCZ55712.1 anthranilate synthase component I family protein [Desulfurispirillum indicum]
MEITSKEAFTQYHAQYGRYLLRCDIPGDFFTPVFIGRVLSAPFIFESVETRGKWSRYTFIGVEKGDEILVNHQGLFVNGQPLDTEPLEYLDGLLRDRGYRKDPALPDFSGGYVGHIGYDAARLFEKLPSHKHDRLNLPLIHLYEFRKLLIIDNWNNTVTLLFNLEQADDYDEGVRQMTDVVRTLQHAGIRYDRPAGGSLQVEYLFPAEAYMESVRQIKEDIFQGEIIQAVLSQRMQVCAEVAPFTVYRALRRVNPSPYTFFLDFGDYRLIGSSPEMHLKIKDDKAFLRPIAGTRRIAADPLENLRLEQELKADSKEISEHIMLVDLARNDLGRFCKTGSVEVTELMVVEHYSHVMHMVSNVSGTIDPAHSKGLLSMLGDTFPAGTVSGAPKIRAMEIIAQHEELARGIYSGVVGYFDYAGNMDTCIAIRTLVNKGQNQYSVQAGAGIVAESDPLKEHEECQNKAAALMRALEMALQMEEAHAAYDR